MKIKLKSSDKPNEHEFILTVKEDELVFTTLEGREIATITLQTIIGAKDFFVTFNPYEGYKGNALAIVDPDKAWFP